MMLKSFIWPGFVLLLLAQWAIPLQTIFQKNKVLSKGISYKFETAPVDPTNPFIGKYIMLNFKENSLKLSDVKGFTYDTKVYVQFSKVDKGFASISSIALTKPATNDYLETTVNYISEEKDGSTIFLNYPFTKYYMEESKAPKAERIYSERTADTTLKTYALIKIYNGDAIIKDVYINDSLINDVINARTIIR